MSVRLVDLEFHMIAQQKSVSIFRHKSFSNTDAAITCVIGLSRTTIRSSDNHGVDIQRRIVVVQTDRAVAIAAGIRAELNPLFEFVDGVRILVARVEMVVQDARDLGAAFGIVMDDLSRAFSFLSPPSDTIHEPGSRSSYLTRLASDEVPLSLPAAGRPGADKGASMDAQVDDDGSIEWFALEEGVALKEIGEGRSYIVKTPGIVRLGHLETSLTAALECEWKAKPGQAVWWPLRPLPVAVSSFFGLHAHLTMLAVGRYKKENPRLAEDCCESLVRTVFVKSFIIRGQETVDAISRWMDLIPPQGGVEFEGTRAATYTQAFVALVNDQLNASNGMLGQYPEDVLEWLQNGSSRSRPRLDVTDSLSRYREWLSKNGTWDFRDETASPNETDAKDDSGMSIGELCAELGVKDGALRQYRLARNHTVSESPGPKPDLTSREVRDVCMHVVETKRFDNPTAVKAKALLGRFEATGRFRNSPTPRS